MFFIPVAVSSVIYTSVVQARGDFQSYNGFRLLQPLITLNILLFLALTGTVSAASAAFAFSCPCVPALVWLWHRTRHDYSFYRSRLFAASTLGCSHTAFAPTVGTSLAIVSSQFDKIIIVSLLSSASMGLYTVAFSLARMLVVFQWAVTSVLLPKIIGQPAAEIRLLLGRAARVSTLVTFTAAVVLIAVGPHLINLFYGDAFKGGCHRCFWILAVDSVLGGLAALLAQIFYALGKPELIDLSPRGEPRRYGSGDVHPRGQVRRRGRRRRRVTRVGGHDHLNAFGLSHHLKDSGA